MLALITKRHRQSEWDAAFWPAFSVQSSRGATSLSGMKSLPLGGRGLPQRPESTHLVRRLLAAGVPVARRQGAAQLGHHPRPAARVRQGGHGRHAEGVVHALGQEEAPVAAAPAAAAAPVADRDAAETSRALTVSS